MAAALETQERQGQSDGMTGDPRRLRTDLMCVHDGSLAQDEHGAFLPPSGVIEQTLRLSSAYVGETPTGRQVLVIAPTKLRTRHTGDRVPLSSAVGSPHANN